ncbi:MAG: PilZ domain-containing protein [Nitrospirota bacterium]|nr:PilZ domain-containing protein [Nitrospirota bacterium]
MTERPVRPHAPEGAREHRVDMRLAIRVVASRDSGGKDILGWVRNLSTSGMFIRTADRFPAETRCSFELVSQEADHPCAFSVRGWVVYHARDGMGIQFEPPAGDTRAAILSLMDGHAAGTRVA